MTLALRHYQEAAVDAIWRGLADHDGNHLAVLPTGTGKALVLCEFVRRALHAYPDTRILVVTHSGELVAQNFAEMIGLWPECPAGIYSAGLNRRDVRAQVCFASIQSIHKKAVALQRVDLIIVDEAQSIPRDADTMWLRFFREVKEINAGHLRVVGLTATAFRLDSGMLHKGKDAIFSRIVYEYSILDAIKEGYLTQPVSRPSATQIDVSCVGTRGGEFIPSQLDAAASDPDTVSAIADELATMGADRRGWIVFGCGIHHCEMLRDAIRERGYSCEGVFATTPNGERRAIIEAFKRQEIRCLVSVSALAVGFNAKHVDLVGLARPTKSAGLYIQACGRGTRLFPGKENVLILDWGGNIARHGPLDCVTVKEKGKGDGSMPVKICPECKAENKIAARECLECGAPFDVTGSRLETKAASKALLSTQQQPEWVKVSGASYAKHSKAGKPDSLRVTYMCGFIPHSEWHCFNHTGYARQKAEAWWMKSAGTAIPRDVDDALARKRELMQPTEIRVRPVGRYVEIVGYRFAEQPTEKEIEHA